MHLLSQIQCLSSYMDSETYGHCKGVRNVAYMVATHFQMNSDEKEKMVNACAVLDIGKLFINKDIFHKNDELTEVERELMDLHSYLGYKLLVENDVPEEIARIVLYHHGRDKPVLKEVPKMTEDMESIIRIVHTIDTYTALTEDRNYRNGYGRDDAYRIVTEEENGNYHAEVLDYLYEQNL